MLLPLFRGPGKLRGRRHFEPDFIFDDLQQSDVSRPELTWLDQRTAHAAAPGVKLPDSA